MSGDGEVRDTTDWPTCERRFGEMFTTVGRPSAARPGRNFVKPEILGHVRDADGTVVEVSTGWFMGHRLYGITYPEPADERSRACAALAEVAEALGIVPAEAS